MGRHTVELFGNFPSERVGFYGSARASNLWFPTNNRPFFMVEYALHDSVRPPMQRDLSLHSGNPPFASPREAYQHYFGTDIGQRTEPWVAVVAPVYIAHVKSIKPVGKELFVELESSTPIPKSLSLGIVCRGDRVADFRERVSIVATKLRFNVGFRPTSLDAALFHDDLQIDFVDWGPARGDASLKRVLTASPAETVAATDLLFNRAFLGAQHPDIRRCLEQANKCCVHQLWVPASLLLRKALDMAVNLKLSQLGKAEEIYTDQYERPLHVRLKMLAEYLPTVRQELSDILTIKWFGDKGAHSKMALYESDIRAIVAPRLRSFLTHLELKRPVRN